MDKVEIIGAPQSNYVRTVRIAAAELGIDYTLTPEAPHTPGVDAIHPLGKIPVMRHGSVALCESRAIIAYLEGVSPAGRLTPEDSRCAAEAEQWVSMLMTSFIPHLIGEYLFAHIFPGTEDGKPDPARVEAALPNVRTYLEILDMETAKTGFLGADRFSVGDAYLLPVLHYLRGLPASGEILAASGGLSAYAARHEARPSVAGTVPPQVEAA